MERESHYEGKSLEVRYFDLVEQIENGTAANPQTLDEPLAVGAEYYRQIASDGNELHEELGRIALFHIVAKKSNYKQKAAFCADSAEGLIVMAAYYDRLGMHKEMQDLRSRAENWLNMKVICLLNSGND